MSWEKVDDSGTRWSWTGDDERHLLVLHDGELREYHEVPAPGAVTVHVYVPDDLHEGRSESHGDPAAIRYPLLETTHVRTVECSAEDGERLRTLNDSKVFEYLEIGKTWR